MTRSGDFIDRGDMAWIQGPVHSHNHNPQSRATSFLSPDTRCLETFSQLADSASPHPPLGFQHLDFWFLLVFFFSGVWLTGFGFLIISFVSH